MDPLLCPCGAEMKIISPRAEMKIISPITDSGHVDQILRHLAESRLHNPGSLPAAPAPGEFASPPMIT